MAAPAGALLLDDAGNLFGTTSAGGPANDGTVFELAAGSASITAFHAFGGSDGSDPQAGLISDTQGDLFGTTAGGGSASDGTAFELVSPNHQFTTLASFDGSAGAEPLSALVAGSNGILYGTAYTGGAQNMGTVFQLVHRRKRGPPVFSPRPSWPRSKPKPSRQRYPIRMASNSPPSPRRTSRSRAMTVCR